MNDAPQPDPNAPQATPGQTPGQVPPGWQPPPGAAQAPWQQAPPGWGQPTPFPPMAPAHPDSNTALIWGIVAVFGGLSFCLPLLASPFAWFYGARVVREIEQSPQPLGGLSEAKAGKVMGIIGTCLLGAAVVGLVLVMALVVFAETA